MFRRVTRRMIRRTLVLLGLLAHIIFVAPGHSMPQSALSGQAFSIQRHSDDDLWIPLSFLKNLGIEPTLLIGQNALSIHTSGKKLFLPIENVRQTSQGLELPLTALEDWLNLRTVRLGDRVYVFPKISQLQAVDRTADGVRFVFSKFTPVDISTFDTGLTLTVFNAQPTRRAFPLSNDEWRWANNAIQTVRLTYEPTFRQLNIDLQMNGPFDYTIARRETHSTFTFELHVEAGATFALPSVKQQTTSVAPGVTYTEQTVSTAGGNSIARSVRVKHFQENYYLRTVIPQAGIGTLAPLSQMAQKRGAAIAINANFFDPNSKWPIGLLIQDGIIEQEDYARRGTMGVDLFGNVHFFNVAARTEVVHGERHLEIDGINRAAKRDEIVTLTPSFGQTIRLAEQATVMRLVEGRVASIYDAFIVTPDRQSTFLVATGEKREFFMDIKRGDPVRINPILDPTPRWPLRFAVSAGPMLIEEGKVVLDAASESFSDAFSTARAARSAIGLTSDGALILLIVLQGNGSSGFTLEELARFMQAQGADRALALDGGGSASLAFRQGITWRNVGSTRRVAVGLALVPR